MRDDLVEIRDNYDGIQWIGRRVDVYIAGSGVLLHKCFGDGIVAHCLDGPRLVVMASERREGCPSAGAYGVPFKVYVREIGTATIVLSDALPPEPPWRPGTEGPT